MVNANEIKQGVVIGKPVTDDDVFWMKIGQGVVKDAVGRVEEAAKQLISITSVLQGIYFAAISFSDLKKALVIVDLQGWLQAALFVSPIIIWLISLGFAIRVLVPVARKINYVSPDEMRKKYLEIIEYKYRHMQRAHLALVLGFVPLVFNVFVYLAWIHMPVQPKP